MNLPPQKSVKAALGAGYGYGSIKVGLFVFVGIIILITQSSAVFGSAVTEGFSAPDNYPVGSVVSISQEDPSQIELTNTQNAAYVTGVTAGSTDGIITLTDASSRLFVAISGDSSVLVSNINGNIQKGDLLGPSAISGVAQRASVIDGGRVLGVALTDFDGTGGKPESINGQDVQIGLVQMRLLLTEVAGTTQNTVSFIERIGLAVTGSQVSVVRVLLSSVLFMTAIFISGMMLFGSIKGSFASIGRNPLASESIFANLMHVTLVSATVLIIGVVIAYLVMAL